jgi:hypothetical protein
MKFKIVKSEMMKLTRRKKADVTDANVGVNWMF